MRGDPRKQILDADSNVQFGNDVVDDEGVVNRLLRDGWRHSHP